ncbi:MAG: AAA family ATPase [Candidatus Pacebacteria bacterium]|nr:AAA family ATPase [Candidatus Paceibacterota bacterium]
MIIAFLGKGGSGKSTMATAMVNYLLTQGKKVLAIDADHNMDLSYNLGAEPKIFLGTDPSAIKRHVGVSDTDTFAKTLTYAQEHNAIFSINPADSFTEGITTQVSPTLRLMTAGPHTDIVRSGEHCSHSLAAPLKVYLPLLKLAQNEAVVIDERAGTDPVATGILKGVDLAVIVREGTVNSTRVADQIAHELELAQVPHLTVDNKRHGVEADTQNAIETVEKFFRQ